MVRRTRKFTSGNWNHILWQTFYVFFAVTVLFFFVINVFLIGKIFSDQKKVFASDFPQYYSAALIVKEGKGNQVYDINTQEEYQFRVFGLQTRTSVVPFRNPPFAALLYIPLVAYTLFQSFGIFASFNFILLFLIPYLSLKTFHNVGKIALLPILPLAFYPNTLSIVRGQVSILILVLFLVFYSLLRSRPFLAGVVYSLLLIKLQFAIVGFPFFFDNDKAKEKICPGNSHVFFSFVFNKLVYFRPEYTTFLPELLT